MNELASRYALSLFELANEANSLSSYQEEVKEIIKLLKDNSRFIEVLSSTYISFKEKEEIIDSTFKDVNKDIRSLMKIAIRNHRADQLIEIFNYFYSYCNEARGVKEGLLYSVTKIDEITLKRIEEVISKKEGMKVELTNEIDKNLIGGIKVVVNSHVYDSSINNHLKQMKLDLLRK